MTGGWLREWLWRAAAVIRPARTDRDLEDELRAHLALAADAASPDTAPDAPGARLRHGVRRAGGLDQAMEALRDQRGVPMLADLGKDLREATRLFTRAPAVAAMAVLSLTLSLALGLTVFRVLNAYVLRGFPYPAAERLYSLSLGVPGQGSLPGLDQLAWSSLKDIVDRRIAWDLDVFYLLGGEYPEPAPGAWVTPDFVGGLGVTAVHGRVLEPSDFTPEGPTHVLISHRLWTTRFGADPDIVGRSVRAYVSDRPDEPEVLTIVGVVAAGFWHVNAYTDVIAPLRAPAYPYMVTLGAGVAPRVATERIEALVRATGASLPQGWRATLASAQGRYVEAIAPLLSAVTAAAVLMVLIACANVAVLLLMRAVRRQHEMAVRLALGASRLRLARLLAVEGLLLAVISTALGLAASGQIAHGIATMVESHAGRRLPGGDAGLGLDVTVLSVAGGALVLVAIVLALAPLAGAALPSLRAGLVSGGRGETTTPAARRARSVLVAAEIAGALALVVGAALMIDSAARLLREDIGIEPDVVAASIGLRQRSFPDPASRAAFFERLLQEAAVAPASGAALGAVWPLQPARPRTLTRTDDTRRSVRAALVPVSAGYFAALGIPLHDGETFAADDRFGGAHVAVVSQSLARRLWPDARAVGREVSVSGVPDADPGAPAPHPPYRVVGVAGDVRQLGGDGPGVVADSDLLEIYVPLLQDPGRFAFLYVPARGLGPIATAEPALRAAIAGLDPEVAVGSPRTLQAAIDEVLGRPRRLAWLLSGLALCSTFLALVGVYGVIAYAVRQREREIGIRVAVGAAPADVTRLFLREGGPLLLAGVGVGLAGAVALGRTLESQLYDVAPVEPQVLAAATAGLAVAGALAVWWPARRAASVDPVRALRE